LQRTPSNNGSQPPTSGRSGGRYGTPSSADRPPRSRGGGGGNRSGRGRSSPYNINGTPPTRLPGGGGGTGNKAAFDRGRIFNSGGQYAVRYEKEKRLWKVGPPNGDHHYRFQLRSFLHGLSLFIENQLEQRGGLETQRHGNGRRCNINLEQDESIEGASLGGEFAALALKVDNYDDEMEGEEEHEESSSTSASPGNTGTTNSRTWWNSSSVVAPAVDAAALPRNAVATTEEEEAAAAAAAALAAAQQQRSQQPQEGPLELSLRLERLDLTDVEAAMLADWAEQHAQRGTAIIRKLWLFGNRLCDDGAAAVARIVALGTVTECHLSHNLISLVGAQKLLETVPVADDEKRSNLNPLWLRLEWNRISLSGLVTILEAQHAQHGLLCDVPEAAREDAAPPLPTLPKYLKAAKQNQILATRGNNEAAQETEEEENEEVFATASPSPTRYQGQTNNTSTRTSSNSAFTRSTRNQLKYIIEQCHCRLPWVSSQFETPSEAAVLREAKTLWGKEESAADGSRDNAKDNGNENNSVSNSGEQSSSTATNVFKNLLSSSSSSSLALPLPASSFTSIATTGPLLLVPDTSALLAMAGADPSMTAPTFFTLEWLFNLSTRGLFGRMLPPREQIFIIIPASVATQLDALKSDAGAKGAVRRFMSKGLDDMGPAGANFLTMLGAHEGEGLVLEHGAEVAGSRGADVGSRGQATDHRIVEVGLYFQQECVKAALGGAGAENAEKSENEEQKAQHFSSSLPVILLTSDNGQQALAKAHGLPAVRMSDLAAVRSQVVGHVEAKQPLTASLLRAALRPAAVAALGKVAARSLQMEFDGAVACLRAAVEHLSLAQRRETALREQAAVPGLKNTACLEKGNAESAAEFEASRELVEALEKRLKEWDGLIRSHQVASRVLQWSTLT
jgi:PIN domain